MDNIYKNIMSSYHTQLNPDKSIGAILISPKAYLEYIFSACCIVDDK